MLASTAEFIDEAMSEAEDEADQAGMDAQIPARSGMPKNLPMSISAGDFKEIDSVWTKVVRWKQSRN
jgi:hypothetical protein